MTERPIIFSAESVRAIMAGRKRQTRRLLTRLRRFGAITKVKESAHKSKGFHWFFADKDGRPYDVTDNVFQHYLPFKKGDILWVRETWQTGSTLDGPQISYRATPDFFKIDVWNGPDEGMGPSFNYDRCPGADFSCWLADVLDNDKPWRSPIHMPRWASRITLEVTEVRVQKLQDTSDEDALAEGIRWTGTSYYIGAGDTFRSSKEAYAFLWNSIHGAGAWDENPWVAAITFKRVKP